MRRYPEPKLGLEAGGENGLKVGRLLFARDNADLDIGKAGFLKHGVEFNTGESKPNMGIEFLGLFVGMTGKIKDQDPSTRLEDPEGTLHGALRAGGMVER
jgi:hypothetical protein